MIGIQTILSGVLVMRLLHVSTAACNWIEVATETAGNAGTDTWRFLDFGSIYATYDVSQISFYKLEWGSSGQSIVFSLADPTKPILQDSVDLSGGDQNIDISVISSDSSIVSAGPGHFCKACSSSESTRYGDTCWGILPPSDGSRSCGCNSGGWTGNGLYYGGWSPGQCNVCACWGGGFAGDAFNGQQKGMVNSKGAVWSICVEEDECGAAGERFTLGHSCQCQPDCGGEFCRGIGKIEESLKETVGGSCQTGTCCCSCRDCDPFNGYLS
eukprot:24833_1